MNSFIIYSEEYWKGIFPEGDDSTVSADLYNGGIYLGCQFGSAAMYIWAIGILAAGQSSTMTGTYAGQFAMEGFLNLQWKKWQRVLFTRTVAILPTFLVAFYSSDFHNSDGSNYSNKLSGMNDLLNCLMSLQLPFALIPTITFTSNSKLMGDFMNGMASKVFSILFSVLVIAINIFFVISYVMALSYTNAGFYFLICLVGIFYLLFVVYLTLEMIIQMGCGDWTTRFPIVGKLFMPIEFYHDLQSNDNLEDAME